MICSAPFSLIFPPTVWSDWSNTALIWLQNLTTKSQILEVAYSMSRPSAWCCFIAPVILANTIHDMLAWTHCNGGVVLNVSALPFYPLFLCLRFWLNHQITVCLPFQVTVSAVSGWHVAWSFPKVCQLLFSASGDKHQRTDKVEKKCTGICIHKCFSFVTFSNFQENVSWE